MDRLRRRRTEGTIVDLALSPDGSKLFLAGIACLPYCGIDGNQAYWTAAYDAATGARLWTSEYDPPHDIFGGAIALGVAPDGSSVFVTGPSQRSASRGADYVTIAYDAATGTQLWLRRYDQSTGADVPEALGVSPDGTKLFVTGWTRGGTNRSDFATVAYDAATGARVWAKLYDGPAHSADAASVLGVSPDGTRVFVTGRSKGAGSGDDYATVGYDAATGEQLWARRYDGPAGGYDNPVALGVDPDGSRLFVTGTSEEPGGVDGYATVAYSTG